MPLKRRILRFFLLSCCLSAPLWAKGFPKPQGWVNDFAGVLREPTRRALQQEISALEHDTGAEIGVVTVSSLDGESVEMYANKLFKEWGIGKKGKDNGVLILVAPTERRMRIEVGYGLEPVLPDGLAGEIIRDQMTPAFKAGDFDRGVADGARRVIAIIREQKPLPKNYSAPMSGSDRIGLIIFLGIFVAVGFGLAGIGFGSKTVIPLGLGSAFILVAVFVTWALMDHAVQSLLAAEAAILYGLGFRSGRKKGSMWRVNKKGKYIRAWSLGDSTRGSGSSSSSSSSSGGDFGGGSSGGGGASGSW